MTRTPKEDEESCLNLLVGGQPQTRCLASLALSWFVVEISAIFIVRA